MDEYSELLNWLDTNNDKVGTPEYVTRADRFRALDGQQRASPAQAPASTGAAPQDWAGTVKAYPEERIRQSVTEQYPPGARRDKAYTDWADAVVAKERGEGANGPGDYFRSFGRGGPAGSWADELNALTYGLGNKLGLTDKTYDEVLAYNRARDRSFGKTNPATDIALQFAGGAMTPYLRGAGAGPNIAYNAALGGIQGAGEGENTEDRISGGAVNAAVSGGMATLFGPTGAYFDRYRRNNVTPGIGDAANRLGVDVPYFVRAADPMAQAEGRRTAQTRIGSAANLGYENMRTGYDTAGEGVVRRTTGAPPSVAPQAAGSVVEPAMERTAQGAERSRGALADEIANMVPGGTMIDPAATRGALDQLIAARAAVDPQTANQGLERLQRATGGPMTWAGNTRLNTELGQTRVGLPTNEPASMSTADFRPIYQASQGVDRPGFIESVAGPAGRARFETNTAQQRELADLQRAIEDAIANRSPEQLINLIHNAASTQRGPTNLNQLDMMLQAMTGAERQQVGGGVLGNIINRAQVTGQAGSVTNPGGVAKAIDALTPQGRAGLFPPGTPFGQDVDAMRVLGERIAAVDRMAHRGSSASLGERMAVPTMGGSALGLGAVAKALQLPPQVAWPAVAAGVASLAGQGIKYLTQPRFAQYGVSPAVAEIVNRAGYGAGRTMADQFAPTFKR